MNNGELNTLEPINQTGFLTSIPYTINVMPQWYEVKQTEQTEQVEYKFKEDEILKELKTYINSTYKAHYSRTRLSALEVIKDAGYFLGFVMGNILKYSLRLGKKNGFDRADVLKIIHYSILLLYITDTEINKFD